MINTVQNDKISIKVNDLGAELTSIKTLEDQIEVLWQGDEKYWSAQSPILFPIVGSLEHDTYELNGKTYDMDIHGFAYISMFELIDSTNDSLTYRLLSNDATRACYPIDFELVVSYQLNKDSIKVSFKVTNKGQTVMPFSIGAHPGFRCPMFDNETIEDYTLTFEKKETVTRRMKDNGVLTGERVPFLNGEDQVHLTHSLFYERCVIMDSLESNWVEISSKKHDKRIRCDFTGFPYLGIWSSANDGPYVCIEPWYGIDSTVGDNKDIYKKEGMIHLDAGKSMECCYIISIT